MALSFAGFDSLARDLTNLASIERDGRAREILQKNAEEVRDLAKEELGHYQPDIGPYPAWPELADATKQKRTALGYTENDPLLMSGQMQSDLKVITVTDQYADVGIANGDQSRPYAGVQELGSVGQNIPPRPFLQTALYRHQQTFLDQVFEMVKNRFGP